MASGTINLSISGTSGALESYIVGKITWSSSNDEEANTSDVTAKLYVRKLHPGMTLTIPTSGTWSYKLTINNTVVPGSKSMSVLEDWVLVTSYTVKDIAHNSNGKKSITISGSVSAPTGTSLAGHTTSGSASVDLGTIPRNATVDSLSCSTSYLDGEITAVYTPQYAFYYIRRVAYLNKGGSLTTIRDTDLGQKAAAATESKINFTDEELSKIYARITDTTKATIRVAFMTYSDPLYLKKVGDTAYKEITLTIPTSVKPTASLSVAAVNSNAWIKGLGVYVAGYSQAKLTLSAEAGEGASLASTTISGEGFTHSGTAVTASLLSSGKFTFSGKATDTRGRSASSSKEITVLPYSPPAVTTITVERGEYTSAWEARENGPDIRVVFKVGLSLVDQGNTYSATFTMDGAARVPNGGATSGLASGANRAVYFLDLDGEVSHTLTFTFTDKVGTESKAAVIVPTDNVTIEYRANGKGIAFGKTSERDGFECAWPAYFDGYIHTNGMRVPLIQWGTASITPSAANTPTSKVVTFSGAFPGSPAVILTPQTSVPGTTVLGAGTSDRSASGVTVWVARTNTTATVVHWVAIY